MRYATWQIIFDNESEEGSVPEVFEGAFYTAENTVAGYMPEDTELDQYAVWNVVELTAEDFLSIAQTVNSEAFFENGKIRTPIVGIPTSAE